MMVAHQEAVPMLRLVIIPDLSFCGVSLNIAEVDYPYETRSNAKIPTHSFHRFHFFMSNLLCQHGLLLYLPCSTGVIVPHKIIIAAPLTPSLTCFIVIL